MVDGAPNATREGDPLPGQGVVTVGVTQLAEQLPASWPVPTEPPTEQARSAEVWAGAHASCFSMALSLALAQAGSPVERLDVSATVTFDQVGDGHRLTKSALTVRGKVPGIGSEAFREAAEAAMDDCPISQALKGSVELSIEAILE